MRKKIMLVLIILATILLTACSTTITAEEIEQFKNIAYEIKNSESYKLPDGYRFSYLDSTTTSKIAISVEPSVGSACEIKAVFDMTKDEPELIEYKEDISNFVGEIIGLNILISVLMLMIGWVLGKVF